MIEGKGVGNAPLRKRVRKQKKGDKEKSRKQKAEIWEEQKAEWVENWQGRRAEWAGEGAVEDHD